MPGTQQKGAEKREGFLQHTGGQESTLPYWGAGAAAWHADVITWL